jgi:hypothetical protein
VDNDPSPKKRNDNSSAFELQADGGKPTTGTPRHEG